MRVIRRFRLYRRFVLSTVSDDKFEHFRRNDLSLYILVNKEYVEDTASYRKEIIGKLEEQLAKNNSPEDDLFYYHPSEDKIVLSHALFWVMPQNIKGKVGKEMYLFLLRQYQEEMLEANTILVST